MQFPLWLFSTRHIPRYPFRKTIRPGITGLSQIKLPYDRSLDDVKRKLYEFAKNQLEINGYQEIGMDHFSLAEDDLAKAFNQKNLHRNFMGYTTQNTSFLLGLGMSAISDSWFGFAQNEKTVEAYILKIQSLTAQ